MWFLLIISIINSAFDQKGFVLEHRLDVAGLPINILDGVMIIGFLGVLVSPLFKKKQRFDQTHPIYPTLLVLFALGTVTGVLMWLRRPAPMYDFASDFRNFTAFAIAIILGHYYLKSPDSGRRFAYVHVLAGVLCSGLILVYFVGAGAAESGTKIEAIRALQYVSVYAGLAAALLMFTILDRKSRILPLPVAIALMGFCTVGQFATLNRSDWIAAGLAVASVLFLLPREGRGRKILGFTVAVPVLAVFILLFVGFASRAMGRADFGERMLTRVVTLLPGSRGEDSVTRYKAWDTRLPGIRRELELWSEAPLTGNGFGFTYHYRAEEGPIAFRHCVWSNALAMTGVVGFTAYLVALVAMVVIGRRMVRQSVDKGSVLIGAIAFTAGVYNLFLGTATMSFNIQRQGLLLGLLCGLLIKAREMQLTTIQEYAGYVDFDDPSAEFAPGFVAPINDGYPRQWA